MTTPESALTRLRAALQTAGLGKAELFERLVAIHLDSFDEDFVPLVLGKRLYEVAPERRAMIVSVLYGIPDTYVGVDSHLPRDFFAAYPTLLEHLSEATEEQDDRRAPSYDTQCHAPRTVRILPLDCDALANDYSENQDAWETYWGYHNTGNIALLQVDAKEAEKLLHDRLPSKRRGWTTDIGIWVETCALLFEEPIGRKETRDLQLLLPTDQSLWDSYISYVRAMISKAKVVRLDQRRKELTFETLAPQLMEDYQFSLDRLFQPQLAAIWPQFVNPPQRMAREGPFLKDIIAKYCAAPKPRILDAAMGTGAESVWLRKEGFQGVVSNEINQHLIGHALEHAEREGQELDITRYDWRHLSTKAKAGSYDVVLVLGNSLTCLLNTDEMSGCLDGFFHVMKPGAVLVIDERNYRYFIDHRNEVMNPGYRVPGRVVYPSLEIMARPRSVPKSKTRGEVITLEYYDEAGRLLGTFDVYAFGEGEFKALLEEAGFEVKESYCNFTSAFDAECEFITYVAVKSDSQGGRGTRPPVA